MSTVFLFKYPEYLDLVKWDDQTPNINWPMNKYDVKIYKGVSNKIEFIVRNNDRKPISLVGYQIYAQIERIDLPENKGNLSPQLLLTKPCHIIDDLAGKARLELSAEEIERWLPGSYRYVINISNVNGYTEYLYTDINRSAYATFELYDGVMKTLIPSTTIYEYQFTPTPVHSFYDTMFVSGPVPGDAQINHTTGTNTIAIYQNNFSGKFWIQGSLTNDAPLDTDWFNIRLTQNYDYYEFIGHPLTGIPRYDKIYEYDSGIYDYDQEYEQYRIEQIDHTGFNGYERNEYPKHPHITRPKLFNFSLNVYWIRFLYLPAAENIGKIEKILCKT